MKQKRRSIAFTLAFLCAFLSALLAACGGGSHSLKLSENTPNNLHSDTPAPASTSETESKPMKFVGQIPDMNAWIALASDGKNMTAFTTDGSQDRTANFAQWFKGPVMNNTVQATPTIGSQNQTPTTASQSRLTANLNENVATGTITLSNGKAYPFTADAITDPSSLGGLYRSEETINNVKYLAGWIIPSSVTNPSASETPSTSLTPSATDTSTPSAIETTTPSTLPNASETDTPSGTTGSDINPFGAAAVINEQNGQLLQAPMPTAQDLLAKKVTVPNLKTFNLDANSND